MRGNHGEPDMSLYNSERRRLIGGCGLMARTRCRLLLLLLVTGIAGSADAQMLIGPGLRTASSGVRDLGGPGQESEVSHFGIWDVTANSAGVYSSPRAGVMLGDLVKAVYGGTEGPLGIAHVIRDGRSGIRIPLSAQSDEWILSGDLVVFHVPQGRIPADPRGQSGVAGAAGHSHSALGASSDESDRVQVAFVGIEPRRPLIIALPKRNATVAHVLAQLHQRTDLARTVRVIRTDPRWGPLRPGDSPAQLADGDVLLFDLSLLDKRGLSLAPAFPESFPLNLNGAAASEFSQVAAGDSSPEAPSIALAPPPNELDTDSTSGDKSASQELAGAALMDEPDAIDFANNTPLASNVASEQPPIAAATIPSPGPVVEKSHAELPPREHSKRAAPPQMASREVAADPTYGKALPVATTSGDQASQQRPDVSATSRLVPAPMEPVTTSDESASAGPLESVSTLTIAIGVLSLAALCFAVSVVWTRIDRTAQALQQSLPSGRAHAEDTTSRRRGLDQLIDNCVPMIEEQSHLPERMDYFGPELGRKRLILDQPHGVAGPHFAVTPEGDAPDVRRSAREPVVTAAGAHQPPPAESRPEARLARAAERIRQLGSRQLRHDRPEPRETDPLETDPSETGPSETEPTTAASEGPAASQPRTGLLDRVLIAMERERRV